MWPMQVQSWCGFPDHHPPTLELLIKTMRSIHSWLLADPANVVVVHCMAGKGRTGVIIAAYFLYSGLFQDPDQALAYFAQQRSATSFGVNFAGQKRYVQFMHDILYLPLMDLGGPVVLQKIELRGIPRLDLSLSQLGCCPLVTIYRVDQKDKTEKYGTLLFDNEKYGAVRLVRCYCVHASVCIIVVHVIVEVLCVWWCVWLWNVAVLS